ncbi:protein LEAD-SENSITIVE 1-like [Nymphaea colorata]|nr:protein LEAD-SENSITIVE 1-like [Nymphaea colorata]
MGVLSNRINRDSLRPGDHIYSWRKAYIYAHHGIYVGEDMVIHFTRGQGQEVGTGTVVDILLQSSTLNPRNGLCPNCTYEDNSHGVVSSCLDCFLAGGSLYRFEYSVTPAFFLAKARGGTCTCADSDPFDIVIHRATHLLNSGFGCYDIFKNNCEDFAIYCKTGLITVDDRSIGQSGQAISFLAAAFSSPWRLATRNAFTVTAAAIGSIGVYCASRYAADVGRRRDVMKISVEDLTAKLAASSI